MYVRTFILLLALYILWACPHTDEIVGEDISLVYDLEKDVTTIDLSDGELINENVTLHNSETKLKEGVHTLYALKSIKSLETKHRDKLNNRNNTFYIKDTGSALFFDNHAKEWTEIKKVEADFQPQVKFLDWLPISFCLDSRLGSGGILSREVRLTLEATSQLSLAAVLRSNIGFVIGVGGILGFKVGMQKGVMITFNCNLSKGELCQLQYRPSYVEVPSLTKSLLKLTKYGFKIHTKLVIKPFRMFLLGVPEHRCWVTKDPNDLQCKKRIVNNQKIKL